MSMMVKVEIAEPRGRFAAVTGDAGRVVDQGEPPAGQPVEQRRFADIRPADDGDGEAHGPICATASGRHYCVAVPDAGDAGQGAWRSARRAMAVARAVAAAATAPERLGAAADVAAVDFAAGAVAEVVGASDGRSALGSAGGGRLAVRCGLGSGIGLRIELAASPPAAPLPRLRRLRPRIGQRGFGLSIALHQLRRDARRHAGHAVRENRLAFAGQLLLGVEELEIIQRIASRQHRCNDASRQRGPAAKRRIGIP